MLCLLFGIWCAAAMPAKTYDISVTVNCLGYDTYDDGKLVQDAIAATHQIQQAMTPSSDAAAFSTTGATVVIRVTGELCLMDRPIKLADWFDLDLSVAPPMWHDYRTRAQFDAAMERIRRKPTH